MKSGHGRLEIETGTRLVTDLSVEVLAFCRQRGDGLLNVFVPHATAGLALMETGSGSESDLQKTLDELLPAFISPSLTIPVLRGRPALGTWQSVVLVDTNVDNRVRQVRLSFLAG